MSDSCWIVTIQPSAEDPSESDPSESDPSESEQPGASCDPTATCEEPISVYDQAREEAEKHKWLESEKHGCDQGPEAIEDWYRQFWGRYCRTRRLEHLAGKRQWAEFADHEFGQMYELLQSGNKLLHELIHRFEQGWENLQFAVWLHESDKPREQIEHILGLLEIFNINIARLEPRLHAESA